FTKIYRDELSVKEKTGKMLYVYTMGFASVAVMSAAIRLALAGEGLDEDDDGEYTDDLMDLLIGSQIRMGTAMIPFAGPALQAGFNRSNDKFYDDRMSASPALTVVSTIVGAAVKTPMAVVKGEDLRKGDIRDLMTAIGVGTGLPLGPLAKPMIYLKDYREGEAYPSGPIDFTRGLITGKPGD
ncbi:MAG: hypothetical protein ACXABY_17970, partial [Candidatus Thorarchaeota archaeon]